MSRTIAITANSLDTLPPIVGNTNPTSRKRPKARNLPDKTGPWGPPFEHQTKEKEHKSKKGVDINKEQVENHEPKKMWVVEKQQKKGDELEGNGDCEKGKETEATMNADSPSSPSGDSEHQILEPLQITMMTPSKCVQMPPRREPDHQELPQATVVAQFRDYHPEKFSGQGDPRIVDECVQGLEIVFEVMNCPDRYRMLCAQIQLTGDARLWCHAYWSMRPGEKDGCTWDQFKELIREKYYPSYYRADMERQFLALTQGTRSVDEYEREFTRLGAFVPDLVGTEAKRAHRFTDGFRPAVRHNIIGHGVQTYACTVAIAQEVDASIRREAAQTSVQPVAQPPAQPKVAQPSTNKNKMKFKGGPDNRRNRQRQKTIPECPTCGKHHRGECLVGQN
ncbi:Unknown protein, partial [Striga hermonthica]